MADDSNNIDHAVVGDFGSEWTKFDQMQISEAELSASFEAYFRIFPWGKLPPDSVGFDMGAGSGRWAKLAAPRVGTLHIVEPSEAMAVARKQLAGIDNVEFHQCAVDDLPFDDGSMDFGYSLGVLHHIPDTPAAMRKCVSKLKPGAPFLVYLYYAFDNRAPWFRALWRVSDAARVVTSSLPGPAKRAVCDVIATTVYLPLATTSRLVEKAGGDVDAFPLSSYRDRSFYAMRTDALDRFGTRLEQRFTAAEITEMMTDAGLIDVTVSPEWPYWCAVGFVPE